MNPDQPAVSEGRCVMRYAACCAGVALAASIVTACGPAYSAEPATPAEANISALLARLSESGCIFNRNGNWYTAAEARQHLARKWSRPAISLASPEDFIALAASRSSETGRIYLVRCHGAPDTPAATWLLQELAVLRGASRP